MARGKAGTGKAARERGADDAPAASAEDGLPDFEGALEELEAIVARLDAGELSLADSLEAFERGIRLTRTCEAALGAAEARVAELLADEDARALGDGFHDQEPDEALDEEDYEDEFGAPDRDD